MRKLFYISTLIVLSSTQLFGQTKESLSRIQATESKSYSIDSALVQLYNFSKENSFFIEKLMPNKYNNLSVKYDFAKGHYIPVQGASQVQSISLFSEGKTTLEKFHLYGSFNYQRSTEDSTRWAHQSRFNNSSPLYFGSMKNNHYERSVYQINAAISRPMIEHNLPISIGLEYRIGNHFSNNDPRGDIKDFQLNINPAIGYTFGEKLSIGLGYQYGYGREQIGVGYKNSSYTENTVDAQLSNYLITGYGGAQLFQIKNQLRYNNDQNRQYAKFFINYSGLSNANIILALKKGKENELFKRNLTDNPGYNTLMSYEINHTSADLIWYKRGEQAEINFSLNYDYKAGSGYDQELAGVNYINDEECYGLKIYYTLKGKNGLINNLNFGVQHIENVKRDGNNGIDISFNRIKLNAGWGINKPLKKNHSIGAGISTFYILKTSSTFLAPIENENIFFNSVMYPDYLFYTSNNYSVALSADYSFPSFKGIQTSIKLSGNYIQRLGNYIDLQRTILNTPGKDRFSSNISLNLYF